MARRRHKLDAEETPEPVMWRDGTHISGTSIWCDARRARDVCFVSCSHAVPVSRHGQLIATEPTLAMLARSAHCGQLETRLSVPYGRPFTLGTLRLELVQSGHAVGSAALAVDLDGERVLYAGAINPHGGGLGDRADVRSCSAVVLAATYGDPGIAFPPVAEAQARVVEFANDVTSKGGIAVLLVGSPSKGLDVAARLAGEGLEVRAHRSVYQAAQRLRGVDSIGVPDIHAWSTKNTARAARRCVLLWLAQHTHALARAALPPHSRVALVSGRAVAREEIATCEADEGFAWSNEADFGELCAFLDACGARRVYLTGRYAERMADAITSAKRPARRLGPPRQMSLF
jgi:putative mRNA 3-end processing factor